MAITLDGTVGITTADIAATTLTVDAGFGSNATAYGVRAWVNFNGTGTVAIRDSGNVSSITDNGTGNYTVNFTNAMPDTNYSAVGITSWNLGSTSYNHCVVVDESSLPSTSSLNIGTKRSSGLSDDRNYVAISVFR